MRRAVALQMDPFARLNLATDSTYRLGLEAQRRGHRLYHFTPDDLFYEDGIVKARLASLTLDPDTPPGWRRGEPVVSLLKDLDVVLMRQDPPFDLHYIANTHLLELVHPRPLVVNDPVAVRNAPEKLLCTKFPELMPPTLIASDVQAIEAFRKLHGDIVLKPLFGHAGHGVIKVGAQDPGLRALIGLYQSIGREPIMAQKFLPEVRRGDKRILMVDGEPVAAFRRVPAAGEIRANMVVGGRAEPTELTDREQEICERVGPTLRETGLIFVGLDTIGPWLTEINTTSPTGIVAAQSLYGISVAGLVWDAIERQFAG